MTNSIFARVATLSDYPRGLMNLCQGGQVVLAPATIHENCKSDGNCFHSACGRSL